MNFKKYGIGRKLKFQVFLFLEACRSIGITVSKFRYRETLSIVGNCRMCLVKVEGVKDKFCVLLIKKIMTCYSRYKKKINICLQNLCIVFS